MLTIDAELAGLLENDAGSSGIDYNCRRLPSKSDIDCTSANTCVCCEAGSERKCFLNMCSCADNDLFLDTAASSPNLSQVADTLRTAASARKRACVGMDSPMIHLRAACTLIASWGTCPLNVRCSAVALAGIPRATNAAAKRSANCACSGSASVFDRLFIWPDRHDFYG